MKDKKLAVIIMLFAGTIIAFTCLFNNIPLTTSFLYIAATLLIFYIIGLIINQIITKINKEAEARAKELKRLQKEAAEAKDREEEQKEAEAEEAVGEEAESEAAEVNEEK